MRGVDVARGNDDRAPLRARVIEDPGECPRNEGNRDQCALADQFSRAGERTTTLILASAVRCPVSGRSISIRNTRSWAAPGGARRRQDVRNGAPPEPAT